VINSFSVRMFYITTLIEISMNTSRSKTHLGETYQNEKKTIQSKVQKNVLASVKTTLSIESKLLLYKVVIKPIWTYGIQLWGQSEIPTQKYYNGFNLKL
jgi:hypothetical protein